MSTSSRDTKNWYLDKEPLSLVSPGIIAFIKKRAGRRILDFGCGPGGYSARLNDLGFDCLGADINEQYLQKAAQLGVKTRHLTGPRLDFPDEYFDTTIMVEVLEHLDDPAAAVAEAARVTKKNVLVTVPNCRRLDKLRAAGVVFEHLLELDHRQQFTPELLRALLTPYFARVNVSEREMIDSGLLQVILPPLFSLPLSLLYGLRLIPARFSFRIMAEGRFDG